MSNDKSELHKLVAGQGEIRQELAISRQKLRATLAC